MITAKLILLTILQNNALGIEASNIDLEEAFCLAKNVYYESRGEPVAGQFAVAHTTLQRVDSKRYPDTICDVVRQVKKVDNGYVCQFSWYCDDIPNEIKLYRGNKEIVQEVSAFETAAVIALMTMAEIAADNTDGATHFVNTDIAQPGWINRLQHTTTYGNHKFYRKKRKQDDV
jgi:spore germination cell wall hydrolase CwlJ-like protein